MDDREDMSNPDTCIGKDPDSECKVIKTRKGKQKSYHADSEEKLG